jgi:hypothetical protein
MGIGFGPTVIGGTGWGALLSAAATSVPVVPAAASVSVLVVSVFAAAVSVSALVALVLVVLVLVASVAAGVVLGGVAAPLGGLVLSVPAVESCALRKKMPNKKKKHSAYHFFIIIYRFLKKNL